MPTKLSHLGRLVGGARPSRPVAVPSSFGVADDQIFSQEGGKGGKDFFDSDKDPESKIRSLLPDLPDFL
jgi:hypothetical protein